MSLPEGITLITCTGGRPKAFELCSKYVTRFIRPKSVAVQWIVIDDVFNDLEPSDKYLHVTASMMMNSDGIECEFVKPHHRWKSGLNTLGLNLLEAIPRVKYDSVFFIEDDDWYHPEYLLQQYENLKLAELVGEVPSRYYNVSSRMFRVMPNAKHASLCQSGIRSSLLPLLKDICEKSPEFIDIRLWGQFTGVKHIDYQGLCVGIKGMPGRPGIGVGHNFMRNPREWTPDPDFRILQSWIDGDATFYFPQAKF